MALNMYLDFKGLSDPMDEANAARTQVQPPVYNPQQPGPDVNQNMPPPGMPPSGGGGNMQMPLYQPQPGQFQP
jgi:hypothetical protein